MKNKLAEKQIGWAEAFTQDIMERVEARLQTLATPVTKEIAVRHPNCTIPLITNIEGMHPSIETAVSIVGSGIPLALVGPTGSGKTFATKNIHDVLTLKHYAIRQVNRATAPHDLIGYNTASGSYIPGVLTDAIKEGGLVCIDELDNGNENMLMLLKGLTSGRIFMPYGMQEVHKECRLVVTMNTWGSGPTREYVGRCSLDAALLDEFATLEWDYDQAFETALATALVKTFDLGTEESKVIDFIEFYHALRNRATTENIRVIFSPRALLQCVTMMSNLCWSPLHVLDKAVFRNLPSEEKTRLLEPVKETIPSTPQPNLYKGEEVPF